MHISRSIRTVLCEPQPYLILKPMPPLNQSGLKFGMKRMQASPESLAYPLPMMDKMMEQPNGLR